MNSVALVGRLVRTPELRNTNSGIAYTFFRIAVDSPYKDEAGNVRADFIDCVAWRGLATTLCKYKQKGDMIAVTGRLESKNYVNKHNEQVYTMEVYANDIQFLDFRQTKEPDISPYDLMDDIDA